MEITGKERVEEMLKEVRTKVRRMMREWRGSGRG